MSSDRLVRSGVGMAVVGLLGCATACGGQSALVPAQATAVVQQPAATGANPASAQPTPAVAVPAQRVSQPNAPLVSSAANPIPGLVPINQGQLGWSGLAFIGGGEANKLWVLDARQHKLIDAIDVGGPRVDRTDPRRYPNLRDAHAVVFSKDFKSLYTVDSWEYAQSWVIRYDPQTFREVSRAPAGEGGHHLALSPDDKYLYVGNEYDTRVSVIDTQEMRKIKDVEVGSGPDYITPTMYWDGKAIDTPYVFVSVDKDHQVAVIDVKTNEVVKIIPFEGSVHGINLTPDGKTVWAAAIGTKQIAVIDVATLEVTHMIDMDKPPVHIVFSPDGKWAYVTGGGQELVQFDTHTYQMGWVSATGGAHLGVTPDGNEVWTLAHTFEQGDRYPYTLAGGPLSNAKVVDAHTGQFLAEIPIEYRPHEIQFVPYSAVGQPKQAVVQPQAAATAVPAATSIRTLTVTTAYDLFQPDTVTAKAGETLHIEIANRDDHAHDILSKGATPGNVNLD
jgi:YVTN family beta-propeller protein